MHTTTATRNASSTFLASIIERAAQLASQAVRTLRLRRERNRAAVEFAQLDAYALRDLGISAGEFDSYWSEATAQAEVTRVRMMCRRAGGAAP